jgi:hypothetical protein
MTADHVLVLAWLLLAHLVGDFILQTGSMVSDKFASGPRRWRGLVAHGAGVGLALTPVVAVYGSPGAAFLVVVVVAHVIIDRWKIRATRHAEAVALAAARGRHESGGAEAGLGPAWTPVPGALFVLDQVLHIAVTIAAWGLFLARAEPIEAYVRSAGNLVAGLDPASVHAAALATAVLLSLLIVNVRAGALFVAALVNPRQSVTGDAPAHDQRAPAAGTIRGWRVRIGPFLATAEPAPVTAAPAPGPAPAPKPADGHASPARIGATIGILERLLIVTFVLTGSTAAIGFVVAAKTLARFKQLDDRDFAEYYLLGTLASVAVALGSGLLAGAALANVP